MSPLTSFHPLHPEPCICTHPSFAQPALVIGMNIINILVLPRDKVHQQPKLHVKIAMQEAAFSARKI